MNPARTHCQGRVLGARTPRLANYGNSSRNFPHDRRPRTRSLLPSSVRCESCIPSRRTSSRGPDRACRMCPPSVSPGTGHEPPEFSRPSSFVAPTPCLHPFRSQVSGNTPKVRTLGPFARRTCSPASGKTFAVFPAARPTACGHGLVRVRLAGVVLLELAGDEPEF
jgi:hypothetical protein